MSGTLYLIPVPIGDTEVSEVIPPKIVHTINSIRHYIVENERTARRMLIKMGITTAIDDLHFYLLNKHTEKNDLPGYINLLKENNVGLLSEAGVPAIADPGSDVVAMAHERDINVVPLVGPSSILMAMMASGLNGQNFAFVGYLPIKPHDKVKRLKQLEQRSKTENQSQIFMDTPFRNNQLLGDILNGCSPATRLCIASNISTPDAFIKTKSIAEWKKKKPELNKIPTIFILHLH